MTSIPNPPFQPNLLVSDEDMFDLDSMTYTELAHWLHRGYLGNYVTDDVYKQTKTAQDIIWETAHTFGISPKFLLVLLQKEQSLIEDDSPSQNQLDWATGYAVCDDCSKTDPRIQKFKGFGNQIYYAASRIRNSYIADLKQFGVTASGIGPGRVTTIDGMTIIPDNFATAVLYTYTPHLHGNQNFVAIWDNWFKHLHVDGSILQDRTTGEIWFIQDGSRRPIISQAALYSRFNPKNLVTIDPSLLEAYPIGASIQFANYSLLRAPSGTVFLLVDDERRGFASPEALRALGFLAEEIVNVTWEDLQPYRETTPITIETIYPQGALLQNSTTGGVYFVENGMKHPIMSREILASRFPSSSLIAVSANDLETYTTAEPLLFPDGTLVAVTNSPDIFVISHGQRRHILDESTFLTYGWQWDQIVWTNERSVVLHPLADSISREMPEQVI